VVPAQAGVILITHIAQIQKQSGPRTGGGDPRLNPCLGKGP